MVTDVSDVQAVARHGLAHATSTVATIVHTGPVSQILPVIARGARNIEPRHLVARGNIHSVEGGMGGAGGDHPHDVIQGLARCHACYVVEVRRRALSLIDAWA